MSKDANPAIGVLQRIDDLWQPGQSWNDGTVLNEEVHNLNIQTSIDITHSRTQAEADESFMVDRQHQSYWMIQSLGEDAQQFRELSNAGTTITEVPTDAHEIGYSDEGNSNQTWADIDSPLGAMVGLVDTVRGPYASGNNAKNYYQYMRAFRWSDEVQVTESLVPRIQPEENAGTDGGFPSGHTNAVFLAGYGLAFAAPEHYNELMLTAAHAGSSREVAGMHSPLDVIGGRILATGLAGATANDPEVIPAIAAARSSAQEHLNLIGNLSTDRNEYQSQLARYNELTSFGWDPISSTDQPPRIPVGAEAILRTRLPYLDAEAQRWILYTIATDSGYVLVDDYEGWGRLNLLAAANGFGSFPKDISVNMDAELGSFQPQDIWRNDIDGPSGLTKTGSGSLTLAGDNSFAGGVLVRGGQIVATLPSSLGAGSVEVIEGVLIEDSHGALEISGDFAGHADSYLVLSLESADEVALEIVGTADFGGELTVDVSAVDQVEGTFNDVQVIGDEEERVWTADYRADGVYLVAQLQEPEPTLPATQEPDLQEPTTEAPDSDQATPPAPGTAVPPTVDGNLPSTGVHVTALTIGAITLAVIGTCAIWLVRRRKGQVT